MWYCVWHHHWNSILHYNRHRLEVDHLHVLAELSRNFVKYLLSEVAHLHTFRELNELHDITLGTSVK